MPNQACPTPDELLRSIAGELPADRAEVLAQHIEHCESCARRLADSVTASGAVAPAQDSTSDTQPAALSLLMGRLHQMRLQPGEAATDNSFATLSGTQTTQRVPTNAYSFLEPARDSDEIGWLGPYRVLRLVGKGGMGLVFEAEDQQVRRRVALKVMRPDLAEDANVRARFLVEARAMAAVTHEHVVKIYQIAQAGDVPYLAMEFLTGESLANRLRYGPAFVVDEIIQIGHQIAEGLAAAHQQGLIHRDVKPDNVFLESSEPRETRRADRTAQAVEASAVRVKLLDFGLAFSATGDGVVDERGVVLGTPAFMSPEQAAGKTLSERSDLFSFGCVLYRMVTGRLPFEGDTPIAMLRARINQSAMSVQLLAPGAPTPLAQLIDQLLASNPSRRPASARAVADQLAKWLPKPTQSRPSAKAVVATIGIALAVVITVFGVNHLVELTRSNHKPVDSQATNITANEDTTQVQSETAMRTAETPDPIAKLDPEWLQRVSQLEPVAQIAEVVAELQRRNPGYDGKYEENHSAEFVRRFHFHSDHVTDISPVRAFLDLETLFCAGSSEGKGRLQDLSPLEGMQLRYLDCGWSQVRDFVPLRGMRLDVLQASLTQVSDLQPLASMSLKQLQLGGTSVEDLSVLKDMPLRLLSIWGTRVRDLSAVRGCPTMITLELSDSRITDLSALKGMPLKHLTCELEGVEDWSVLGQLPLETVRLPYKPELHFELLKAIPTLTSINYRSAPNFLKAPVK